MTTSSTVTKTCATVWGCAVSDHEESTETDDTSCRLAKRTQPASAVPLLSATATAEAPRASTTGAVASPEVDDVVEQHLASHPHEETFVGLHRRANEDDEAAWTDDARIAETWECARNTVFLIQKVLGDSNPRNQKLADRLLKLGRAQSRTGVTRVQSTAREKTVFWHITDLPVPLRAKIRQMKAVSYSLRCSSRDISCSVPRSYWFKVKIASRWLTFLE